MFFRFFSPSRIKEYMHVSFIQNNKEYLLHDNLFYDLERAVDVVNKSPQKNTQLNSVGHRKQGFFLWPILSAKRLGHSANCQKRKLRIQIIKVFCYILVIRKKHLIHQSKKQRCLALDIGYLSHHTWVFLTEMRKRK